MSVNKSFWIETELATIDSKIAEWTDMIENGWTAAFYTETCEHFEAALELFRAGDEEELVEHMLCMESDDREELIECFTKDCGVKFVRDVLGFEINKGEKSSY
tara:strand:+ start:115 stop:423 length:309 start_codon:yes stop_codon:yes gene_type:complete